MNTYTAMLALPFGDMAADAATRIPGAELVDNEAAGVWVTWTTEAETDEDGIHALQEARLRAEMDPRYLDGSLTPSGAPPSLFQGTPFIITRGGAIVVHSEEVICI